LSRRDNQENKTALANLSPNDKHHLVVAANHHPDCRPKIIQIVAL
jgi:hypothetical protein